MDNWIGFIFTAWVVFSIVSHSQQLSKIRYKLKMDKGEDNGNT